MIDDLSLHAETDPIDEGLDEEEMEYDDDWDIDDFDGDLCGEDES